MIKVFLLGAAAVLASVYAQDESRKVKPVCGGNSTSGCGQNCGKKCTDYPPGSTEVSFFCTEICKLDGCDCDPGYVFDNCTNTCVVPDDCCIKAVTCTGENQVYEICPAPCPPRVCGIDDTLIDCAAGPQIGDSSCAPPACRCKQGYYKNDKGDCVLFEECPKCDANPNEVYDPCFSDCPPRRCDVDSRVIRCAAPPTLGDANCLAGCRCADGYKRDKQGICIPENECPPFCNSNEVASNCTNGGCFEPRYCSERGQGTKCVKLEDGQCRKGCLCKEPLLRDELSGECVPEDKCPETPICEEENQVFDYCPKNCPPRRCDVDPSLILCQIPPQLGDPECEPGCRCKDGYKIGEEGKCIPEENCQVNPCKKENEEYLVCPRNCPPGVCGINDLAVTCAPVPDIGDPDCPPPACKCKFGFYRDDKGNCVRFEDCPKCDENPNEVYDPCFTECGKGCNVDPRLIKCAPDPQLGDPGCLAGCRCADGFKRNETGICVPEDQCQIFCDDNEVPSDCINGGCYGPRNCSQIGGPSICVDLIEGACRRGCLCAEGYFRDDATGKCVLEKDCPEPCKGKNEFFDECSSNCSPQTCASLFKPTECLIQPAVCRPACRCEKGYYRNDDGICIPEKDCQPTCGENEVSSDCTNGGCFGPRNCSQIGRGTVCVKLAEGACKKGCLCKEGYLRDDETGECVLEKECPVQCRGKNEVSSNCINFGCFGATNCSEVNRPVICIDPVDPETACKKGCVCAEGYLRDDNTGDCVPEDQCPDPKCEENEELNDCFNGGCWDARYCSEIGNPTVCARPQYCIKGCLCVEGYVRDDSTGKCIPRGECPEQCCGENEVSSNCINFGCFGARNCSEVNRPVICIDPVDPETACKKGCVCAEGYLRDDNTGDCVPEDKCPDPICEENEELNDCFNGGCWDARYCSEIGNPTVCARPQYCIKGCLCVEGYVRDDSTGKCIPREECPEQCCGENEVSSNCINFGCFGARNCSEVNRPVICIDPVDPETACKKGCVCAEGYLRDDNTGDCVPEDQCPDPKCEENEELNDCFNGGCWDARYCSEIGNPTVCARPQYCIKGCLCVEGYVRDDFTGKCIPREECPEQCRGENEVSSNCINFGCFGARNCSEVNRPVICIDPVDPETACKKGCVCAEGYLRDDNTGDCVPEDKCPDPICEENEELNDCFNGGCWDARYCSEIGNPTVCARPQYCIKGCLCVEGYVRDDFTGKCIPREECPEQCRGENEVSSNCINFGCFGARNCSEVNRPVICIDPVDPETACKKGCVCAEGYLRDDNTGDCVPEDKCPDPICEENEELNDCFNGGCWDAKYCSEIGNPTVCARPQYCIKGCLCVEGYVRDDSTGKCIPREECPEQCRGENEVSSNCINFGCFGARNCSEVNRPVICIDPVDPETACKKGCVCAEGYLRDDNTGDCVPEDQCPDPKCEENEELNDCFNGGCWDARYCSEIGNPTVCARPQYCIKGCLCVEGYVRDDSTGKCIPREECPGLCPGENQYYEECAPSCSPQSCQNVTVDCFEDTGCQPACRCKDGYLRNNDDECVLEEDCQKCKGPNELYDKCSPQCSPQTCRSIVGPRPECLPLYPGQCFGACRCIEGYYRNDEGICIPKDQCKLCTNKNEIYVECSPQCTPETCSSLYEAPQECNPQIQVCRPACRCVEGFYRDDNGDCIPKGDCPCRIGEKFESDDGCNTCTCQNGTRGSSPCTRRACVQAGPVET